MDGQRHFAAHLIDPDAQAEREDDPMRTLLVILAGTGIVVSLTILSALLRL